MAFNTLLWTDGGSPRGRGAFSEDTHTDALGVGGASVGIGAKVTAAYRVVDVVASS